MWNRRTEIMAALALSWLAAASSCGTGAPAEVPPVPRPAPVAAPAPAGQPAQPTARPNLLFLVSDDHSDPDLGCYGNTAVTSPNLDALAGRGIRFTRAYVSSPQCSPSRSAIVTGRTPHATGTSRLHAPLRGHPTVVQALRDAGYYTGAYRKVHLGDEVEGQFDFRGDNDEPFATFFDRRPADRPFFLHVGFDDPHRPYEPGAFAPPHDPARVVVPSFLPDTPEVRRDLAMYYDEIARMDAEVGELLALLERHGLTENTLVVFAGDNGMPFPGAKGSLHEPGVRVPLIAAWPGQIAQAQVSDQLVSLVDLAPTWLDAAGLSALAAPQEGRSLLPLARGESPPARAAVFSERNWHDNLDQARAAHGPRYKLIYNYLHQQPYRPTLDLEESPSWQSLLALRKSKRLSPHHRQRYFEKSRPVMELYDLERDPDEKNNLASSKEHAAVLQEMQELLTRWMRETNDHLPPPLGEYPASHQ
jgi:N-sulfoglucosamine sulfohydrolase